MILPNKLASCKARRSIVMYSPARRKAVGAAPRTVDRGPVEQRRRVEQLVHDVVSRGKLNRDCPPLVGGRAPLRGRGVARTAAGSRRVHSVGEPLLVEGELLLPVRKLTPPPARTPPLFLEVAAWLGLVQHLGDLVAGKHFSVLFFEVVFFVTRNCPERVCCGSIPRFSSPSANLEVRSATSTVAGLAEERSL